MPETATERPQEMTPLDRALEALRLDTNDAVAQSEFYDLFLNTTFCVPRLDPREMDNAAGEGQVLPLIMESDGNDFLMIFDTEERLKDWASEEVAWVGVPGYALTLSTMPPLHLALNVGTDYSKIFIPDEIAWLREAVERCSEEAAAQEGPNP